MYLPVNVCSTLAGRFLCGTLVQKAADDAMLIPLVKMTIPMFVLGGQQLMTIGGNAAMHGDKAGLSTLQQVSSEVVDIENAPGRCTSSGS